MIVVSIYLVGECTIFSLSLTVYIGLLDTTDEVEQ